MEKDLTFSSFRKSLDAAGLRYAVLPLAGAHSLLVTEHWGKAFGPFRSEKDCGTLWVSPKAAEPGSLRGMVESGDWCAGGDRLWLAPEVQFNIPDRKRWNSEGAYVLPREIDPGRYSLRAEAGLSSPGIRRRHGSRTFRATAPRSRCGTSFK